MFFFQYINIIDIILDFRSYCGCSSWFGQTLRKINWIKLKKIRKRKSFRKLPSKKVTLWAKIREILNMNERMYQ